MNQHKVVGTRFEIWLELLLNDIGFQNVLRNVEYRKVYTKKKRIYRQVDLAYNIVQEGKILQVVLEAKYSSNGLVRYNARGSPVTKGRTNSTVTIRGPLEQIAETKDFIGADIGCLVTNSRFDDKIRSEAKKYGLLIMEGDYLAQLHQKRGGKGNLNQEIQATNINDHNLYKNIIYI